MTTVVEKPASIAGERFGAPGKAWTVLASAIGSQALFSTVLNQAFGAYIFLLQAEFGWSKTLLSGAYSMQQAESGTLAPIQGWLIGRFGVQTVIRTGFIVAAAGFFFFSQMNSVETFFLSFMIISVGSSMAGQLSLTTIVVSWFDKRRTTALSFLNTGFSIAGLLVPVVAIVLATIGWRATAAMTSALLLVVGLPLTFFLRTRPPESEPVGPQATAPGAPAAGDFTFGQAIRTPAFWLLSFTHAFGAALYAVVAVHLLSAVIAMLGLSLESAAPFVALVTAMNFIGQLAGGFFGDRYDKRLLITLCMIGMTAGFVFLTLADSAWMICAFAAIWGIGIGARGPLIVSLRADYFGRSSFAQVFGLSMTIVTALTMLGPLLVGALTDATGSYRPGFALMTGFSIAAIACFLFVRRPAHPGAASQP